MSMPSVRRSAKRAGRAKAVRAKVSARRTQLRELRDAAAAGDPSRNLHVERGRAVVGNDIFPYARPKCKKCEHGVASRVKDAEGKVVGLVPCRCAHLRFMKAHPEIIVDKTGASWWPLDAKKVEVIEDKKMDVDAQRSDEG